MGTPTTLDHTSLEVHVSGVGVAHREDVTSRPQLYGELKLIGGGESGGPTRWRMCPVCGTPGRLLDAMCACGHDFRSASAQFSNEGIVVSDGRLRNALRSALKLTMILGLTAGLVLGARTAIAGAVRSDPTHALNQTLTSAGAAEELFFVDQGRYTTDTASLERHGFSGDSAVRLSVFVSPGSFCVQGSIDGVVGTWVYGSDRPAPVSGSC